MALDRFLLALNRATSTGDRRLRLPLYSLATLRYSSDSYYPQERFVLAVARILGMDCGFVDGSMAS